MLRIFYGDDRIGAQKEIERVLGGGYEVVEGDTLRAADLPSLFLGTSLFGETRRILVKDLGENGVCWGELSKYLITTHEVVVWESKLDKRTVTYKDLAKQKVEMREFKLAEAPEKKLVFDVLDTAWRGDGKRAVGMVEKLEIEQDPYMFFGLMVSQAIRKLEAGNARAREVILLLAEADMEMKRGLYTPWLIIKKALVKIAMS
jgi:hypothetical protein